MSDVHLLESQQSTDTFTTAPSSSTASHTDDDRAGYIDVQAEQDEAIAAADMPATPLAPPMTKRPSYQTALAQSAEDKTSFLGESPLTRFEVHVANTPTQPFDTSASFSGRSSEQSQHTAPGDRSRSSSQPLPVDTERLLAFSKAPPRYPSPLTTGRVGLRNAGSSEALGEGAGIQRSHRPPSYSKITRLGNDGAVTMAVDVDALSSPVFVDANAGAASAAAVLDGGGENPLERLSSSQQSEGQPSPGRTRRLRVNLAGLGGKESTL